MKINGPKSNKDRIAIGMRDGRDLAVLIYSIGNCFGFTGLRSKFRKQAVLTDKK